MKRKGVIRNFSFFEGAVYNNASFLCAAAMSNSPDAGFHFVIRYIVTAVCTVLDWSYLAQCHRSSQVPVFHLHFCLFLFFGLDRILCRFLALVFQLI
jgi:hypothetical protein